MFFTNVTKLKKKDQLFFAPYKMFWKLKETSNYSNEIEEVENH